MLQTCLLALLAGFLVGLLFAALKLPAPAPPAIAGILGILGIYFGGHSWSYLVTKFFS